MVLCGSYSRESSDDEVRTCVSNFCGSFQEPQSDVMANAVWCRSDIVSHACTCTICRTFGNEAFALPSGKVTRLFLQNLFISTRLYTEDTRPIFLGFHVLANCQNQPGSWER